MCAEIARITLNLEEMQVAMRFSNEAYHSQQQVRMWMVLVGLVRMMGMGIMLM